MRPKLILLSLAVVLFIGAGRWPRPTTPDCTVTVLDVGQGDAILIQTRDHQDILIDGGPDEAVVDRLSQALPAGDRDIELMVLTHPHADHVNGLVPVTERFIVRRVLETGVRYQQKAYQTWHQLLADRRITVDYAQAGQQYQLGAATLQVLWPVRDLRTVDITTDNAAAGGGVNDSSVVLRLLCGTSAAMLTGDASGEIEQRIVDSGVDIRADLLKVGHHGSRFSSSLQFLQAVKPRWALISVGAGNHYQHPHPTTLQRFRQLAVGVFRTDRDGSIIFVSDGRGSWRKAP